MILDIIIYTPMYVTAFWAILLLSSRRPSKNKAKSFLGIFMIFALFIYISHALFFQNQYLSFTYFDPIYTLSSLSVYPLYYCYIKLLTVENRFQSKNLIFFLPALIFALGSAINYALMGIEEAEIFVRKFYYNQDGAISRIGNIQMIFYYGSRITFAIQVIFFLIKGSKLVTKYNKRVANFYSNLEGRNIAWVKLLLTSFVITSIMSIVFNILGKSSFINSGFLLLLPSIIFSTLIYFIGFQGYLQNYTVADLISDENTLSKTSYKELTRSRLKTDLLKLFEQEEIFINSDLKIIQVAEQLNTNRTYLSNLINEEFKCTFSDFVGNFRIQKAKQTFSDDYEQKYSIEYISEQVGFGSIGSFIRVFKKNEGITPSHFRNQLVAPIHQMNTSKE